MTEKAYHRLVKLGRYYKRLYTESRSRRCPGYKMAPGTWNEDFWTKLAVRLDKVKVNPEVYVELMFQRFQPQYPMPNQLLAESSIRYYEQRYTEAAAINTAEIRLASQNHFVEAALRQGRTVPDLIADESLQLNPVFSVCLARSTNTPIDAELFDRAREFLATYPFYTKTTLGRFIPEELVKHV